MIAQIKIARTPALTEQVVETLYEEALILADEARLAFDAEHTLGKSPEEKLARSVEGMKTTTRIMHSLAWLLNQRARFAGELSEKQIKLYGALPSDQCSERSYVEILSAEAQSVVLDSEALHQRIARLDRQQRVEGASVGGPALDLQDRLERAFAA